MKSLPAETDFVVIGAGIAGLRATIELSTAGRVLVLAKDELPELNSPMQPGHTAPLSDEDEITVHLQDTLTAGDGLCNPAAVKALVEEAPERIEEVIAWSAQLDRDNRLIYSPEVAHSRSRVLHAQGEATVNEILRTLLAQVHSLKNVFCAGSTFVTDLIIEGGRVTGVSLVDETGVPAEIACGAALLASGGMGQIYRHTTNPDPATADGAALAFRAGAEVSDMEFIQFHSTALYLKKAPRFPLGEDLRSEGGHLRTIELNRFMGKYHPMGELAPRDVMTRAIMHEMEVSRAKDPFVYLDLTHLDPAKIRKRLPRIYATCMRLNIDITEDLIPVRPAAHYALGGVRTDLEGQTNVPGLFAAGEVAATGAHGANRLASNALLESLVYGARAGRAMCRELKPISKPHPQPKTAYSNGPVDVGVEQLIGQIQDLMWTNVGPARMRPGMQSTVHSLEEMAPKLAHPKTRRAHEASHIHTAALLVARSALAREESRGAHYRMDYPDHDDRRFLKHSISRSDKIAFV